MIPVKRLRLTDLRTEIAFGCCQKALKKGLARDQIMEKWNETKWAKSLKAKEVRKNL